MNSAGCWAFFIQRLGAGGCFQMASHTGRAADMGCQVGPQFCFTWVSSGGCWASSQHGDWVPRGKRGGYRSPTDLLRPNATKYSHSCHILLVQTGHRASADSRRGVTDCTCWERTCCHLQPTTLSLLCYLSYSSNYVVLSRSAHASVSASFHLRAQKLATHSSISFGSQRAFIIFWN